MFAKSDDIEITVLRELKNIQRYLSIKTFVYKKIRLNKILYFLAYFKFKKLASKCRSFDDYLNLVASFSFSIFNLTSHVSIMPMQIKSEITKFCKIIAINPPKTVLEIGTARGGTLFLLTRLSSPNALILSIDYGIGSDKPYREVFYKSFLTNKQKLYYFLRNSHLQSTLQEIKKKLKDKKIDLLFIDGDHSYKGVKKDFEMYSPLVKKKGIIAFHDIIKAKPGFWPFKVYKFWNEIKE
ncbi:MAG: class I SAM-dependent methyltransferase, partial [Promethearchaeota archaeon]